jgi:hypothetical protein
VVSSPRGSHQGALDLLEGNTVSKLRRSWFVIMMAIGLLATAGVASAGESVPQDEAAAGDTLVSYGYAAENHVFIVHTSSTDSTFDCSVPSHVMVGYGSLEDGSFAVTVFDEEGVAVEFLERPSDEPTSEAGESCQFSGSVIGGPNGQINHGQFMKLFHQILGKKTSGCLNRVIAQSDLGKGDQQVGTSDIEDTLEVDEAFDSGEATFESFLATCDPGKKEKGDDHPSNNKDKSKSEKADRPQGKSANAPGKNK